MGRIVWRYDIKRESLTENIQRLAGESKLAKVFGPQYIDFSIVSAFFFFFPYGKI
jgi:hypothetical protein